MSPRDSDFYIQPDGTKYPRVTAILKVRFPFDGTNWASYLARDNTRRFARTVYDLVHPAPGVCLGLDGDSFDNQVRQRQGNAPPHKLGQDAAEVGTAVHKYAEAIMRVRLGENARIPVLPTQEIVDGAVVQSRHQNAIDAFHAWLDAHLIEPLTPEIRLVSKRYGYAGTADLIARVDTVPTLVDFKTSKGIFDEYPVQVAAYRAAAIEMGLAEAPMAGLIARFPKEAGDTFEAVAIPWEDQEYLFAEFLFALEMWERVQKYGEWFHPRFPYKKRVR